MLVVSDEEIVKRSGLLDLLEDQIFAHKGLAIQDLLTPHWVCVSYTCISKQ